MTIQFNYTNDEVVSSPTTIVSGRTDTQRGTIEFVNNNNQVFPPQHFEINNGNFKAILHVSPGINEFEVKVADNGFIDGFGYARYNSKQSNVVDKATLRLQFFPLENKPVHLCLILGRDSKGTFDMPSYKLQRGEVANLETAVKKLKVAGRLMQAYTQDEMRRVGFSNRTFQFVEETVGQQNIFGYDVVSPTPHQEVKVHVLRSPKSVAELRDPNLAQQNPKGKDTGGLFSHAIDLIRRTPEIYSKKENNRTAVQCAVIYLDAHYDRANDLILTHAALGGGTSDVKLAIFGSHGLHSWPINFPAMTPCFLDDTALTTKEVANDAHQCGTSWECYNITLGAFMHEIGHSLGCPHQVDGVMLRDYIWWNRSFITRENHCIRSNSKSMMVDTNGNWPRTCHWNRLDLIRFLYHDSFSIPIDKEDSTFAKVISTTNLPDDSYTDNQAPVVYTTPTGPIVKSNSGIYLIELITKNLARSHIPMLPRMYGGSGPQKEAVIDYETLWSKLRNESRDADPNFSVKILSLGGELNIDNFKSNYAGSVSVIESDFGLGRGKIKGYRSVMLGRKQGSPEEVIGFEIDQIYKVRVYHGGALDGVRFYFYKSPSSDKPPVPRRNYLSKISSAIGSRGNTLDGKESVSVLIGNEKAHFTDIDVQPTDPIVRFNFRNGAWMDAMQVEFSSGKKSAMLGNANGGHLSTLEAPGHGYKMIGMYAHTGNWLDGLGIIHTNKV